MLGSECEAWYTFQVEAKLAALPTHLSGRWRAASRPPDPSESVAPGPPREAFPGPPVRPGAYATLGTGLELHSFPGSLAASLAAASPSPRLCPAPWGTEHQSLRGSPEPGAPRASRE